MPKLCTRDRDVCITKRNAGLRDGLGAAFSFTSESIQSEHAGTGICEKKKTHVVVLRFCWEVFKASFFFFCFPLVLLWHSVFEAVWQLKSVEDHRDLLNRTTSCGLRLAAQPLDGCNLFVCGMTFVHSYSNYSKLVFSHNVSRESNRAFQSSALVQAASSSQVAHPSIDPSHVSQAFACCAFAAQLGKSLSGHYEHVE